MTTEHPFAAAGNLAFVLAFGSGCSANAPTIAGDSAWSTPIVTGTAWRKIDAGCPPSPGAPSVDDPDAGPLWACTRTLCAAELSSCTADCECNNQLLSALDCVQRGEGLSACFVISMSNLGS